MHTATNDTVSILFVPCASSGAKGATRIGPREREPGDWRSRVGILRAVSAATRTSFQLFVDLENCGLVGEKFATAA